MFMEKPRDSVKLKPGADPAWLGADTSIINGGVKLVYGPKPPFLMK
jgi:hypothetical protein